MRLGRGHGTLEAECEGSIAHKFTFTSRRGAEQTEDVLTTRGDLVLVRLTHGVTWGYADARETGGLCRRSRNWGVVQTLECAGDRIAVVCQRGKLLDFCICRLGGWRRRRSVCVDVMIARQCAR